MAHHDSADFATIFDPDFGEGHPCRVAPEDGPSYAVNVLVNKDVQRLDELNNIAEKVTLLVFVTDTLQDSLRQGDEVTVEPGTPRARTYTVERLVDQDTYISRYSVS